MNVVHVIRDISSATGGPVSAIQGLTANQLELGYQVSVVTTDYGSTHKQLAAGVDMEICPCLFKAWRYAPSMKASLARRINNADVVHIHTIWEYPSILAASIARQMGKACILRPCGMLDKWSLSQSSWKKNLYLKALGGVLFYPELVLHFTTEAERNKSRYSAELESFVVGNGISDFAFSDSNTSAEFYNVYPELKGKRIVLFLGRIDPKKQPDVTIRAFAAVAGKYDDACLVIAGPCERNYLSELIGLISEENIQDRVVFTGILQGSLLFSVYKAATVFVLPSLQENFGISVGEAMAASCPVIISKNVDIKDIVESAEAGIVCSLDVAEVAIALELVLDFPDKAKIMGENGRQIALQQFAWKHVTMKLDEIYRSLKRRQ